MYKYEMDPTSIVEDTEQTQHPQMDRQTDWQGETNIPPFNLVERGYNNAEWCLLHNDGLMQKQCNSIANALELHLFCIEPTALMQKRCMSFLHQANRLNAKAM